MILSTRAIFASSWSATRARWLLDCGQPGCSRAQSRSRSGMRTSPPYAFPDLLGATDRAQVISDVAQSLLLAWTPREESGCSASELPVLPTLQEDLFAGDGEAPESRTRTQARSDVAAPEHSAPRWIAGADVEHDDHGRGWVWGSGPWPGHHPVRNQKHPPGPVRTFAMDDPALHLLS